MADNVFYRDPQRFFILGMDLNRPVDAVKELHTASLSNLRSYQAGRLETRKGLTSLTLTGSHSIRRLNDPANANYARISGHTTHLYVEGVDKDSGYSGDPLAMVPYRPDQSPASWMYIADRSRMRKVNQAGTVHQIGMPAPLIPPVAVLSAPSSKLLYTQPMNATNWTSSLPGGATSATPTTITRISSASITITGILFDTGTSGWCCIQPSSILSIGDGMDLAIGGTGAETVVVQSTHRGGTATTIGAISFDSGTAGACALVLAVPYSDIDVDSLLYNTTRTGYARVEAIVFGPDGTPSIRCTTPAASAWAAGDTIATVDSFRCYCASAHSATATLANVSIQVTADNTSTPVVVAPFTAYLQSPKGAFDLTTIAAGIAANPSDYLHVSIYLSLPEAITDGKIEFGLFDTATPSLAFTQDYAFKPFRVSDLTSTIAATPTSFLSAQQAAQTNAVIEGDTVSFVYESSTDPVTGHAQPRGTQGTSTLSGAYVSPEGYNQGTAPTIGTARAKAAQFSAGGGWKELRFRISDLIRVGNNINCSLKSVFYIRLTLTLAPQYICIAGLGSVSLSGGYGPDSGDLGSDYLYRYRARCSTTGAKSNWSPATRGGLYALRQQVSITATQYTTATEADVLDFQRWGGQLLQWNYIGQVANGATPTFLDKMADDVAAIASTEGNINYQPWPIIGLPVSGTTTSVCGTSVKGSSFSLSWAPGTRFEIDFHAYTIYRVVSATLLELVENASTHTTVAWRIVEPIVISQNLPCFWGPLDNFMFACGDTINPQRLYWLNKGSEGTQDTNYADITSPSEPLMNGVVYNGRSYVWSTERFFQLLQQRNESGTVVWQATEIPGGKGLFSRWAFTGCQSPPGPILCFLGKEGIYATNGSTPTSLTDDSLYPLFPNEGNLGSVTNGIYPPDIQAANATSLRLSYYDEFLYFDFVDTNGQGTRHTLVYAFDLMEGRGGWFYDTYTPSIILHYGEEGKGVHSLLCGGGNGNLYQYYGTTDAGTAIAWTCRTASRNQGDSAFRKLYNGVMLDAYTYSNNVTAIIGTDNYATTAAPVVVNTASRLQTPITMGTAGVDGCNIALNLAGNGLVALYLWESRWHAEGAPVSAFAWETDEINFDMDGYVYSGDLFLSYISTANVVLTFTVDNVVQPTVTLLTTAGLVAKTYMRLRVMKGKMWKIRGASTAEWRPHGDACELRVKQWGSGEPWKSVPLFVNVQAQMGSN